MNQVSGANTSPVSETVAGLRSGHVNNELLDLRGRQEYTQELLARLREQLAPVLNDHKADAVGAQTESTPPALVPLAEEIRHRRDIAEGINEILSDILSRLEI